MWWAIFPPQINRFLFETACENWLGMKAIYGIYYVFRRAHTAHNHFGCRSGELHGVARPVENMTLLASSRISTERINDARRGGTDTPGCDRPIDWRWFVLDNNEQCTQQSTVNLKCFKLDNWLAVSIHFPHLLSVLQRKKRVASTRGRREGFRLARLIRENVAYLTNNVVYYLISRQYDILIRII